jgi:hypothetical protein
MSFVQADRVKETSTTTGTGTYSLAGAATGFRTFVAGLATGSRCTYCVENGTDWEINEGIVTDATPDTLTRAKRIASSTGSAISWAAGTRNLFCVYAAAQPNPQVRALTANYSNSTTTGTEVTGLSFNVQEPGTYYVRWILAMQSAATTTSPKFGVNITGAVSLFTARAIFPSAGVTAATGQIEGSVNATTGSVMAYSNTVTESTTAPNLGPWTGVVTAGENCEIIVECLVVATATTDIELWAGSEVAASAITLVAGSSGILTRTA